MDQKGFAPLIFLIGILVAASGSFFVLKNNPSLVQKVIAPNIKIVTPSQLPSQSSAQGDMINISGKYNLGNNQSVDYSFSLPKSGGLVQGQLTGLCAGQITGEESKPNDNGKSAINGKIEGNCHLSPNLPFAVKLSAVFDGSVNFKESKVSLNYTLNQPISSKSTIEIPFYQSIKTQQPSVSPSQLQPSTTPIQSHPTNQPSSSGTQVTSDKVTYTGVYKISDAGNVNYNISFSRQGGSITGTGSGDCQATITGQVKDKGSDGIRPIAGTIQAKCKSLAPVTDKTNFNGTFWGSLDDQKGKIEIIHNGIFETDANSYLEVTYTP